MPSKKLALIFFLALFSLAFKPLGLVFMLVFPGFLLFKVSIKSALITIPLAVSFSVIIQILNAVILDTFSLPVTYQAILAATLLESFLCAVWLKNKIHINIAKKHQYVFLVLFFIFGLTIVSRVLSIAESPVPILHDPISHAYWASKIAKEQAIDYFYSPGLHIWTWLISETSPLNLAQSVNIVTGIFGALSVLLWPIAAYIFTNKARVALWTGFWMLLVPLPQFLQFLAGKNAFVMAMTFSALSFIALKFYDQKKTKSSGALFMASLISVGLIHYPTFVFAAGSTALFIAAKELAKVFSRKSNIIKTLKTVLLFLVPVIISSVVVLGNAYITSKEDVRYDRVTSRSAAKTYHEAVNNNVLYIENESASLTTNENTKIRQVINPITAAKNLRTEIIAFFRSLPESSGLLLLGAGLVSLYFLIFNRFKNKQENEYKLLNLSFIVAILLVILALSTVSINGLGTTRDTGILLIPTVLALSLGVLFAQIEIRKTVEIVFVLSISIFAAMFFFNLYRSKVNTSFVDNNDIEAYSWINENISDHEKFVGLSHLDPNRKSVVFSIDGSLWLPVFTGNNIATPFQELRFRSVESNKNYEYTKLLSTQNQDLIKASVDYFRDNGYSYLYVDGPAAKKELGIDYLVKHNLGKYVYSNDSVSVVQLIE